MKQRSILLIVLGCLLFSLTACSDEDINFVQSMLEEWANAKNVNPQNKDGSINFEGLINAGASALGSGDDEVKAAIDAKGVVDSIQAADKAAEDAQKALKDGKAQEAVNLLDPAVKDRPNDWWLLNQRGVARLEAGDDKWKQDLDKAGTAKARARALEHQRQLLEDTKSRQIQDIRSKPPGLPMCNTYIALGNVYSDLFNSGTGEADFYRTRMNENSQALLNPGVTCR